MTNKLTALTRDTCPECGWTIDWDLAQFGEEGWRIGTPAHYAQGFRIADQTLLILLMMLFMPSDQSRQVILTIVIPACDEQKQLPGCLTSIEQAVAAVPNDDLRVEVIVVDNNSTDATAVVAEAAGAKVIFEPINQISRARNSGAAAASGDWLLFMDADSRLHLETLTDLLTTIDQRPCVGGGCLIALDCIPFWVRGFVALWNLISRSLRWAAGSFIFARPDAFTELSGFSEEIYASEEIDFSRRLKRWGKSHELEFIILKAHPHVSSGRKFQLYRKSEIFLLCFRLLFRPIRTLGSKGALGYFYERRR